MFHLQGSKLQAVAQHLSQSEFHLAECRNFRPLRREDATWLLLECMAYPFAEKVGKVCICGRLLTEHSPLLPGENKAASKAVSGILEYHEDFGSKTARHRGQAWYARIRGLDNSECYENVIPEAVDKDEYFKSVADLLLKQNLWNMQRPQLIIDIMGTYLDLLGADPRTTARFSEAITRAAASANAWIVTNGLHTGVSKLVGNACSKARRLGGRTTCLGIAPWGVLANADALESTNTSKPNCYRLSLMDKHLSTLNAGHNYLLLVDNGTVDLYNEEQNFRTEFLDYLCQVRLKGDEEKGLPYVMLVVGGGPRVLKAVQMCVTGDVKNPAVLLTGFGGAADVLGYAYSITSEDLPYETFSEMIRNFKHFKKMIANLKSQQAGVLTDDDIESFVALVKACVEDKNLIRLIDVHDEQEMAGFDKTLLGAIFDSDKFDDLRMLSLARQWNQVEIAEQILEEKADDLLRNPKTEFEAVKLMVATIQSGQWPFYALLRSYHLFDPDRALTLTNMKNRLYLHINDFLKSTEGHLQRARIYRDVARALGFYEDSSGDQVDQASPQVKVATPLRRLSLVSKRESAFTRMGQRIADNLGCLMSNPFEEQQYYSKRYTVYNRGDRSEFELEGGADDSFENDYITKYRDLLLLQLVMNHREFAINAWHDGCDLIGTALMASTFLSSLSINADRRNLKDLALVYKEGSEQWENRARNLMETCHREHPDFTHKLLRRKLPTWQDRTVLEIAHHGNQKAFVAQSAVQLTMQQVWYGRIVFLTSPIRVILTAIFPFLIFGMRFIPEHGDDQEPVHLGLNKNWKPYTPKLNKPSTWWPSLKLLYTAPICRSFVQGVFSLGYLGLFTWFILKGRLEASASNAEIFLIAWSFCLLFEVIYESFGQDIRLLLKNNMPFSKGISIFIREVLPRFNIFDWNTAEFHLTIIPLFFYVLFFASIITRFTFPVEYFNVPRTTYALTCLFLWARCFRVFYLSKNMGVIVVSLIEMFPTIVYFMLIYVVLLLTFATPIYALMHPNRDLGEADAFLGLFLRVVYDRFWNLFYVGLDADKEEVEGTCKSSTSASVISMMLPNATAAALSGEEEEESCSERNVVAVFLFMVYVFLTMICWMNMLLASLAAVVEKTMENSIKVSQFSYFVGVRSVYYKSYLPTPFNVIEFAIQFIRFMTMKRSKKTGGEAWKCDMEEDFSESENELMDEIERDAAEKVIEQESLQHEN